MLKGDTKVALAAGEHGRAEMLMATHIGLATDEFEQEISDWMATAKHLTSGKPVAAMVYQPVLELLACLRANGFKTFIVSGGGIEFIRPWTEGTCGIPTEQVIGSSGGLEYELQDSRPVLVKTPEIAVGDDKEGKSLGVQRHIGRCAIATFGSSGSYLQMLQWIAAGSGPRFCLYVQHADVERAWAYDVESYIGQLDKGLDQSKA